MKVDNSAVDFRSRSVAHSQAAAVQAVASTLISTSNAAEAAAQLKCRMYWFTAAWVTADCAVSMYHVRAGW
jgi:hypothetical protein